MDNDALPAGSAGYDAIVLAGGAGRRLGGAAKPQLRIGDVTLLDRALDAVSTAGRTVVVGPPQPAARPVVWAHEDPPGSGPVAALAAAVPFTLAPVVMVLGADLPWIGGAVAPLLDALGDGDVALLADASGRRNHLAAVWCREALVASLDDIGSPVGAAMRDLVAGLDTRLVADTEGWGDDCDTWGDVAAARERVS